MARVNITRQIKTELEKRLPSPRRRRPRPHFMGLGSTRMTWRNALLDCVLVLLSAADYTDARAQTPQPANVEGNSTCMLAGTIERDDTHEPIGRAQIDLYSLERNANHYRSFTDSNGRFSIGPIPGGGYHLIVSKGGF